ncbi:chw-1 [Pristionchus pacificus]|uniref:Chw-1 n=1 Tax=Pristionchus pacificus TaxID=54126 RepID=A0A2A6C0Z5_PRIPA|nr:chw-1 [Pristionchus pacificus]|eukprot:PDM71789.1 chw-1 [Pristionchus pacificus]
MEEEQRVLKCVLVGDAEVGKTALAVAYSTNGFPQIYTPTAYDNYSVIVRVDKQPIRLQLCDTAGSDSFTTLRPLSYTDANVFILVYSTVNPLSLKSVVNKWLPEVSKVAPDTPLIIVGTKVDLAAWGTDSIPTEHGRRLAASIGADFFECSAVTQQNLKQVFDCAILAGLTGSRKNQMKAASQTTSASRLKQRLNGMSERIASFTRKVF